MNCIFYDTVKNRESNTGVSYFQNIKITMIDTKFNFETIKRLLSKRSLFQ